MAAKPIVDTIWRGSFMISHPKVSLNLTAHLSSKACAKVWLAAKEMAEVLCFELLPRLDVWPKSFKSSKLIDDNIAIYFFSVKGRDDQVFDNLLYNLRHYDFALKALVGDSELLIFTSAQLPEKHQRFEGQLYLWGVFNGRQAPPQHSSDDCFIYNTRVTQASTPKLANDVVIGKDGSCNEFSNKKDPSAPASKTARKGRPLDDAWQHATPVDGKKQRTICKYCGFVSSSGGITYLKTHLGGGDPTGSLKGCPNVPPDVKRVMTEWLQGTIRGVKAPQLEDIRTDMEAHTSKKSVRRGRPLDAAWEHATPVDAKRQRAVCKYCGFISSSGGITHLKAHLAGGDPKGPSKGCPNAPPEVRRVMAESLNRTVKGVKAMQPEEIRRCMKAENVWSPPKSDDYSLNQYRIVKNEQYSNLASGGNHVKDMTMSKQSETACIDSCMEVISSHNACKSSFLSKPTTKVGFL
ncbi:uncharacterized protein LOC107767101 isoform X1 [Nicotiana tabacum]|uniref:Uncharacterized protein LOC107767101 isoform X1 n=5 Tax=Nicotiana TaxID=4085 RepID=A0AC58SVV8_TOBAC|nr:PREDICTED: uncharacterized protein LOC104220727 isoform X2 [Nicotiana sylvestris]XP_016441504.1 PREDICTED: uncharacterized protein LOC107767101 isoform X3 [Nicotiana tabacum]